MKNIMILFFIATLQWVNGNAQPIPEKYTTTHQLKMIVDVKVKVNEDSLIYEKCQMFANESFLEKLNRSDTTKFYYLKDASVVVVDSKSPMNGSINTEIYDAQRGIRLKLVDQQAKYGLMMPYDDKPGRAKHEYTWKATGKKETIEGIATEIYEGKAESYRGPVEATIWLADSKVVPASLMRKLPPVKGLQGIPMKYVEKESEKCSQMTVTMQLHGITEKGKEFDLKEWVFEGSGSETQNYEEEYGEEMEEAEEMEQMEEAEEMEEWVKPAATWEDELLKFEPIRAEIPTGKATTKKTTGDSLLYISPFPMDGIGTPPIIIKVPENWQIENDFIQNGWPVIRLSSMKVEDLGRKTMEEYDINKSDQVIIRLTKIKPHQEFNTSDGLYDDHGVAWRDDVPLYNYAIRYYENDMGNELKMERYLIQRVIEDDDYFFDDYLIEGFLHGSEDKGLVERFVKNFIELNEL